MISFLDHRQISPYRKDHVIIIIKQLQLLQLISLWRKMVTVIPINYLYAKERILEIEVKAVMGPYSGCPPRWGWCKKLSTQISQLQITSLSNLWTSSKIFNTMPKIAKSTHPATVAAATTTAVLGFAPTVTQPLPLFGGVALEVLRLFFFFTFV